MARNRSGIRSLMGGAVLPVALLACDTAGLDAAEPQTGITIDIPGRPLQTSRSIEEAIAIAQAARATPLVAPIVISLPSGTMHLTRPIAFTAANGGTARSPLILRGQPDGSSVISGAVTVAAEAGATGEVTVDLARTAPVLKPDLTVTSTEAGDPAARLLLYQGRRALSPSSWPASGYATDWTVVAGAQGPRLTTRQGRLPIGDGVIAAGYLSENWQYQTVPATSDGTSLTIRRTPADAPLQKTVRLRLLNIAGPLAAGRYTVAGRSIRLRGFAGAAPVEAAVAPSLFTFDGAHDIRIESVAIEKTTGTAVRLIDSADITLADCFVGRTGGYGVDAAASRGIRVERCVVAETGGGGVRLNGGDRTTLQPARNHVHDSRIVRFGQLIRTYAPGIALTGVGSSAAGSFVGGAPHAGIVLAGNDHLVERNELAFLACETDDASAIYMGRDWTQRGNRMTRNFLHDIGPGTKGAIVSGIYLDDQFSGTQIDHNVMLRMPHGIYLGGGRDNRISDNIFAALARSAVWIDDRGMNWQRDAVGPQGVLRQTLDASPYLSPLWRSRYPTLPGLLADRPGFPVGNNATGNIVVGGQFLWAIPATLTIPGAGNRELPNSVALDATFAAGSPTQQYQAFGRFIALEGPVPGLRTRLLYDGYADTATGCPVP